MPKKKSYQTRYLADLKKTKKSLKFDGKLYRIILTVTTKKAAKETAETIRRHGGLARIRKGKLVGKKVWRVYRRN